MQLRMCRRMQCAQYSGKDLYISKLCISAEELQSFVSSFGVEMLKREKKINFSSSRLELQPSRTIANEQAEQRPRWVRGGRGRRNAQTDHQEPPQHAWRHGG